MKTIYLKTPAILLLSCMLASCFEETGYRGPDPSIKILGNVNQVDPVDGFVVLPRNTKLDIRFNIQTENFIKRIEVYRISGIPANTDRDEYQPESSLVQLMERRGVPEGLNTTLESISDTFTLGENEVAYSVYVEDIYSNFNTGKITILTDIAKFTNTLQDGNPNGTSSTFMSLTSGRSFFVYNTIQDPKGIDMGFAYLEALPDARGCLISLDEYWKAGSYPGIVNDNYSPMEFRKPTSEDSLRFFDPSVSPEDLKTFFDRATPFEPPAKLGFTQGKIAPNIKKNNVIAFKIRNQYYGLIWVQLLRGHTRPDYTQEITLQCILQRKTNY